MTRQDAITMAHRLKKNGASLVEIAADLKANGFKGRRGPLSQSSSTVQ